MGGYTKDQLLARLQEIKIDFASCSHPVVLTVEAQAKYVGHMGGGISKNLFLKDKKHRYYIVSALASTNVDLKILSQRLGLGKGGLRMAPEEALQEILQVPLGCVTPFALINESAKSVSLLLDHGFKSQERCLFHPLSNDITISLKSQDLDKFLISIGRSPSYVDLEANISVGKDQPPDLAAFVQSGVSPLTEQLDKIVLEENPSKNNKHADERPSGSLPDPRPNNAKRTVEKLPKASASDRPVLDVRKLIDELIGKTTVVALSEISKEPVEKQKELLMSTLDAVRKRIGPDLENLAMSFKNAAYTEGFHSGVQSVLHRGLQGSSSHK